MAGRLGNKKITVQNLKVLKVDVDNSILLIKGAVPGHKGAVVSVFDSVKKNQEINSENVNNLSQGSDDETKTNPNLPNNDTQEQKIDKVQSKVDGQEKPEDIKNLTKTEETPQDKEKNSGDELKK